MLSPASEHVIQDLQAPGLSTEKSRSEDRRSQGTGAGAPVVTIENVTHRYGNAVALDGISLEIPSGRMVGIIGPDGVGKSTLMALIAGSKKMQEGTMMVLGGDIADARHRHDVCPRIAYMPQGLGKNLYLELSVQENVDFMARLFGLSAAERPVRIKELLDATGLGPFPGRPAGKLSGGMKQKVGLCGALVHEPDLLILDEPTTGVDPLSRRQFWTLIDNIRAGRPGMSVLISTAYMDEAQKWDWIVAMDAGKVLATGSPAELMQRTGTRDLEQCFIALLPEEKRTGHKELTIPPRPAAEAQIAIDAKGLTKRFGSFTAVDHVTLSVERGEIFGFLGSNGCGKSTTMKMLTGLLPPSEGTATLFGQSVEAGSMEVRENLGYMTQAFSLYGELTVRQNLVLDARLYHIAPEKAKARIDELVEKFGLGPYLDALADALPLGMRQRLSLAVAVLHDPQMLILDEPTSGVDPVARDSFWELLIDLSRQQGVTIFITTHFMNEGMRCDRISLMNAGKVLACDAPQKLIEGRGAASLEDAFIAYMEDAIAVAADGGGKDPAPADAPGVKRAPTGETEPVGKGPQSRDIATESPTRTQPAVPPSPSPEQRSGWFSLGRMLAYTMNETMQIRRDPVRLAFAFVGSLLLMLVFGFGITTDVEHIRYATFDLDRSPESRTYLEQYASTGRWFTHTPPVYSAAEALERLQANDIALVLEIPPNFGRDFERDSNPEVSADVDGANPFRGETVAQYAQGVQNTLLRDPATGLYPGPPKNTADIQERYMYNPTFESIYSIVPSVPALLLILIPAILMAVSVVREKELGSIINFYVTPTGRLEYLMGKQLPYIAIGMINFFLLVAMAILVFRVPVKGSFLMLTLVTLLYVVATTGIGLVTSTFTSSQVAAVFVTAILTIIPTVQFSGLLQPVSTLQGQAQLIGLIWPTAYYMHSSVGAYTKGLAPSLMMQDIIFLACCIPLLLAIGVLGLRKQEK
jgi:ribosome-dependent ATPase